MEMDTQSIVTIILAIIGTLGGKELWGYLRKKLDIKAKIKMHGSDGETELRDEIKNMLEGQILELKGMVTKLTRRINDMDKERERDKKRIANQEIKIALLSERLQTKFKSTGKHKHKPIDLNFDTYLTIEDND